MSAVVSDVAENARGVATRYTTRVLALPEALQTAAQADDYARMKDIIQQCIGEAETLQASFKDILSQIQELESSQARRELYSERWWQQKLRNLRAAFQDDPEKGFAEWLRTYAGALVAWELAICQKLVAEPFRFPSERADITAVFQNGTQAILDQNYGQALGMLAYLTQPVSPSQARPILDEISRATLLVLTGRIHLYETSESVLALEHFEHARELTPNYGLPYAALGSYYRAQDDRSHALTLYQQAIELSPDQPDGYVGMGLLAEDDRLWDEASDWYEDAIEAVREEKDIGLALSKLLAPVSGNLYLQLARMLKTDQKERALEAVTRAISVGINYEGEYPERIGYRLKGDIQRSLSRQMEAAESYYEAGWRFLWDDEYEDAVEQLNSAAGLKPDHAPTYWCWADALRLSSNREEPPYVDRDSIENSRKVWKIGIGIEPPGADYSWAYYSLALINEQLGQLADTDEWTLGWEASAYLERAILLDDTNATYLASLGRCYRSLSMPLSALQATSKAIDNSPEDASALIEWITDLANLGQFATAEEAIGKLRELLQPETAVWADVFEGLILMLSAQHQYALRLVHNNGVEASPDDSRSREIYQEALKLIEKGIEAEPDKISSLSDVQLRIFLRSSRAACYKRLGNQSRAVRDYRWIWDRYDDPSYYVKDQQSTFAWAAYEIGMIDEAIEIYRRLREEPIRSGNAYRNLGVCYLAKGDLARGTEFLDRGIRLTSTLPELDDLCIDLKDIERASADSSDGARVREALDQAKEKITLRRVELEQPQSAVEELRQFIATLQHKGETTGWPWISAHAGLARLLRDQGQQSEAKTLYQLLLKESDRFSEAPDPFPEARLGLEGIATELQEEGDLYLQAGRPDAALEEYREALSLVLESMTDQQKKHADLRSRIGYARFELGDLVGARENFTQAIELYRDTDLPNPGGNLGAACQSLLQGATQYWALEAEWEAWNEETGLYEPLQADLLAARESLAEYLNELYQLSRQLGEPKEPFVTPIILEIGEGLIPEDTGPDWSLFKTYIPEMRARTKNQMGVQVPGVRVRAGNLPPDGYRIMLDEIPRVESSVQLDRRYCPASPDILKQRGIPEHNLIEASNPLTGEPGCWIQPDDSDLANGLELWDEPLLFVIYHLEVVLRRNLSDFVGVQEAEGLLEEWEQDERGPYLIRAALPDQASRLHFARLLRSLLREHVPITAWKVILEVVHDSVLTSDNIGEVMRAVRLQLKKQLPGNDLTTQRLELPPEIEDTTASWLRHENGRVSFAAPPQEAYEFVAGIRNLVRHNDRNFVLVTRSPELRPFIRRLIEFEFPYLMVLSQEELLSHDELVKEVQIEDAAQNEGTNRDE